MTKSHTIMIVDDHPLMRRGIKQLLELDSNFDVVAEANCGSDAILKRPSASQMSFCLT